MIIVITRPIMNDHSFSDNDYNNHHNNVNNNDNIGSDSDNNNNSNNIYDNGNNQTNLIHLLLYKILRVTKTRYF